MLQLEWIRLCFLFAIASTALAKTPTIDQVIASAASDVSDANMLSDDGSVLVELDMRFSYEEWIQIQEARQVSGSTRVKRKALRRESRRWPFGDIPFTFTPGFSNRAKEIIQGAMNSWAKITCLNFRKAEEVESSINFVPTGGCSSYVGRNGMAGQPVTLGPSCLYHGIIMHELGHALGFIHEHSRPDRDQFVTIQYQNVKKGMSSQFQKFPAGLINTYNIPYDYRSIMHYGPYYFTKNQLPTMKTKNAGAAKWIGNRYFPSFNDIHLANLMYSCSASCTKKETCPDGFQGKDCRCWCKGPSRSVPLVYCDSKQPVGSKPAGASSPSPASSTAAPVPTTPPPEPTAAPVDPDSNKPEDKLPRCSYWAKNGACDRYPAFMKFYCNASCAGLPETCEDVKPRICRIFSRMCGIWSSVQKYCRKTCGVCTYSERKASCIDVSLRSCRVLVRMGLCTSTNPTVKRNVERACPRSCGKCEVANTEGACTDKSTSCTVIKAQGRCNTTSQAEVNTLKAMCPQTCNLCPKTRTGRVTQSLCADRLSGSVCPEMKKKSRCRLSRYFVAMRLYCRYSCGLCDSYGP